MWFDEPPEEGFSREVEEGIIVKYNSEGVAVGIEILFVSKQKMVVNAIPEDISGEFEKIVNDFVNTVFHRCSRGYYSPSR